MARDVLYERNGALADERDGHGWERTVDATGRERIWGGWDRRAKNYSEMQARAREVSEKAQPEIADKLQLIAKG